MITYLHHLLRDHEDAASRSLDATMYPAPGLPEWFVGPDLDLPQMLSLSHHPTFGTSATYRVPPWAPEWISEMFVVGIGFSRGKVYWTWGVV